RHASAGYPLSGMLPKLSGFESGDLSNAVVLRLLAGDLTSGPVALPLAARASCARASATRRAAFTGLEPSGFRAGPRATGDRRGDRWRRRPDLLLADHRLSAVRRITQESFAIVRRYRQLQLLAARLRLATFRGNCR